MINFRLSLPLLTIKFLIKKKIYKIFLKITINERLSLSIDQEKINST
jgi:hypothetical protein